MGGFLLAAIPISARATAEEDLDRLMGPIALYPDPLLAQVLTAATSPQQVTEFHQWLGQQTATGSDLQQAAQDAKFDPAFASLALFPDVIKMMAESMDWTTAIGTAYQSDKDAVTASVQRLRGMAKEQGNLESSEQQNVKVESAGSTQTIIIEPANPQIVYVPQYEPTVVYTEPAPSGGGMLLAFGMGIAIGAAMNNSYYGWSAWGYGGGGVHYHHGPYMPPPYARYPYARPVPGYRPPANVYAPRNTNVNINVNGGRGNAGNNVGGRNPGGAQPKAGDRNPGGADRGGTNRPGTADRPSTQPAGGGTPGRGTSAPSASTRDLNSADARGRSTSGSTNRSGSGSTSVGGYNNGSSTRASSQRGRSSAGAGHSSRGGGGGGGGRRR
jgi:uncharacterized protein DUF3300